MGIDQSGHDIFARQVVACGLCGYRYNVTASDPLDRAAFDDENRIFDDPSQPVDQQVVVVLPPAAPDADLVEAPLDRRGGRGVGDALRQLRLPLPHAGEGEHHISAFRPSPFQGEG